MNGILLSLTVAAAALGAPPEAPTWISDYGTALKTAQAAQRPLLVVLETPQQPQFRVMLAGVTTDQQQTSLLAPYLLCRVDASTPYGRKVAEVFGVSEFPYTVITDKTATRIIYRKAGQFSGGEWSTTLTSYQNGQRPATTPSTTSYFDNSGWSGGRSRGGICFT